MAKANLCRINKIIPIITHAKFYSNQMMFKYVTELYLIRACESPTGPEETLKRLGLIGLRDITS